MVSPVVLLIAIGAGVFALARFGSPFEAFGLLGSDLVGENQQDQSGEVTTDRLQANPSIPIPQGSQGTISVIQSSEILRTDIRSKQKLNQNVSKPMIKTTFFNPNEGGSEPQAGILTTTNSSLRNTVLGLNAGARKELRAQPFTKQEQADIVALTARFNRKSASSKKVSDSPQEIIFKKREQAEIARRSLGGDVFVKSVINPSGFKTGVQVEGLPFGQAEFDITRIDRGLTAGGFSLGGSKGGGLFANPTFLTGGVSLDVFRQQQIDRIALTLKQRQNAMLNLQREKSGEQLLSTIAKSGLNQKQFLLARGIKLNTGNLSAKALGRLREKGLI